MPIKQTVPTNSGDYLQFGNATTPVAASVGGYEDSTGNGHLELYTTASGTVTERMRIDSSGNVGIGTSSPNNKLNVAGIISTSGTDAGFVTYRRDTNATAFTMYSPNQSLAFYDNQGGGERMRIDSSGNVLVNTTSVVNGSKLSVNGSATNVCIGTYQGTASSIKHITFSNTNNEVGSISTSGTSTAFTTSSDYRLKENIQSMVGALDTIAQLKPVTYNWIADGSKGQGFIAHELAEIVPDCVTGEKDAVDENGNPVYQGIDTSFLVATLTAAIQELSAKVTALEAQLGAK